MVLYPRKKTIRGHHSMTTNGPLSLSEELT